MRQQREGRLGDALKLRPRGTVPRLDRQALLTERSVTRAAGHLNVGQSAMSSSLGRLRKLLMARSVMRQQREGRLGDALKLRPRGTVPRLDRQALQLAGIDLTCSWPSTRS
jgi:hypothetical protein